MLEISNVYKTFDDGKNFAINGISLSVYEGDNLAIVSESGGGKTTLLQLINRLIQATSGDIHFKGDSIYNDNEKNIHQKIAYISDESLLFPHLTVLENLLIGMNEPKQDSDALEQKACELIELVHLDPSEIADCYPEELSLIETIPLIYAQMLSINPEVILLDNPFKGLDRINRTTIMDLIHQVNQKLNKTFIFATDDIDDAKKFTDRIAILNEGRLVQSGEFKELVTNPTDDHVTRIITQSVTK